MSNYLFLALVLALVVNVTGKTNWESHGGNLENTRNVEVSNYPQDFNLTVPDWILSTGASVSATPAIFGDFLVFPDWSGFLWCVKASNKNVVWKKSIGLNYYNSEALIRSRSTPSFWKKDDVTYLILGVNGPADVLKVRLDNGLLEGIVSADSHIAAIISQSGQVYGDHFYIGVSSREEFFASQPGYPCCSFVGKVVKVNLNTMTVTHSTPMISPDLAGVNKFSGNAIWGGSVAIDEVTGLVLVGTGNNYEVPLWYEECIQNTPEADWDTVCNANITGNMFNSVVALTLSDLTIHHHTKLSSYDAWNLGCGDPGLIPPSANCPETPGPDADFGMSPTLSWINEGSTRTRVAIIGQKNGMVHCLDATEDRVVWSTQAGPGGDFGGIAWGLAVDDDRVYASIINNLSGDWLLLNGTVVSGGGWVALDVHTGETLWTTANPAYFDPNGNINGRSQTSEAYGAPLVVGNSLLVTSGDSVWYPMYSPDFSQGFPVPGNGGFVYHLDKVTGTIKSSYETGASVHGSFSSDGQCAYVGSGYLWYFETSEGTTFLKFCRNGN